MKIINSLYFFFILVVFFESSACPIDLAHELIVQNETTSTRRLQNGASIQPIRILFDFSNYDQSYPSKLQFLNNTLIQVANTLQSILSVPRVWVNIILNATVCNTANVPSLYQTSGAPGDLIIFVTSQSTAGMENLEAWSSPCSVNSLALNRVTFAQLNILPSKIPSEAYLWRTLYETLLHETIHILGFHPALYRFYVDSTGNVRGESNVIQNFTIRGIVKSFVVTETVLSNVRTHFGCSQMNGGELEDQGSSASVGSHWERRIFGDEIMSASSMKDSVFSNISLGLLKDTGWYQVNFSLAENLKFGKQMGCDWNNVKCIVNGVSQFPSYFTTNINSDGCYYDYTKRGRSLVYTGTPISANNYFNQNIVSFDPYADNCPSYVYYDDGDCRVAANHKILHLNDAEYGANSRCFMGTFIKQENASFYDSHFTVASCFRTQCVAMSNGSQILVFIGDQTINCPMLGGNVSIPGYKGELFCPPAANFCSLAFGSQCPGGCSNQGSCFLNGTCQCNSGFFDGDCGMNFCSSNSDCGNGTCDSTTKKCQCFSGSGGRKCSDYTLEYFSPKYAFVADSYQNSCITVTMPNRKNSCGSFGSFGSRIVIFSLFFGVLIYLMIIL